MGVEMTSLGGSDKKFQDAAEAALREREQKLAELKSKIDAAILSAVQDSVVTFWEMKRIYKLIKKFEKIKRKFDKELGEVYERRIETNLLSNYYKDLMQYFDAHWLRSRDHNGKVKKAFLHLTGRDVYVKSGLNWLNELLIFNILFTLISICLIDASEASKGIICEFLCTYGAIVTAIIAGVSWGAYFAE